MRTRNEDILTQHDLLSINSMVNRLAIYKGFHRENAYYILETEFNVDSVTNIKRRDLCRALAILTDLENVTVH